MSYIFPKKKNLSISTSCLHNLMQALRLILGEIKMYLYKSLLISKVYVFFVFCIRLKKKTLYNYLKSDFASILLLDIMWHFG